MKFALAMGAAFGAALVVDWALAAQPAPTPQDESALGRATYARANCIGCHKWHGNGGGGYGGAALSLRKTELDREQIIKTVSCGRPGTGMPYFIRGVYDEDAADHPCYGFTRKDVSGGDNHVAEATIFLRPAEVEAVADYVLSNIKGRGEPNLAECVAFFGDQSRVCEIYQTQHTHQMPTPSTTN